MSTRVAYPFKRIGVDDLSATVSHDLKDTKNVILSVSKIYAYTCKLALSEGSWDALWENAGVEVGTLVVYWVSGGAGSRELLLRRVCHDELPRVGGESFDFSFKIPGHLHTENAAVLLRVISARRKSDDDLGAEQGGILWEQKVSVPVRGAGALMKVEYADAPAGKGLSAGPGEYIYTPDRGYEIVVYTSHLPGGSRAGAPAIHGAVAALLERVLRDAFVRLKDLNNAATKSPENENEIGMLSDILGGAHKPGRKSPKALLEQEAGSGDSGFELFNWCWEVAGSVAKEQIESLGDSTDLLAPAGEER